MSTAASRLCVCLVQLAIACAGLLVSQEGAAGQETTEAERLDQKLAGLTRQKVTVLGSKPLPCLGAAPEDNPSLFYSFDDKDRKRPVPLNKFAGQTGVILEAKRAADIEIIIQLDNTGEKLVGKDDRGLGFHAELEAARRLIGSRLWAKSRYNTIAPAVDLCRRFSDDERVKLKKLQSITVTAVEFGDYEEPIVMVARTDAGREGRIYLLGARGYFDESFHRLQRSSSGGEPFSRSFLSDDPRKAHPGWSDAIWRLIEEGEVGVGMTEDMVNLACVDSMAGEKLQSEGFVISPSGDEVSTIYKCSGKRFIIEKGKVTRFVFDR